MAALFQLANTLDTLTPPPSLFRFHTFTGYLRRTTLLFIALAVLVTFPNVANAFNQVSIDRGGFRASDDSEYVLNVGFLFRSDTIITPAGIRLGSSNNSLVFSDFASLQRNISGDFVIQRGSEQVTFNFAPIEESDFLDIQILSPEDGVTVRSGELLTPTRSVDQGGLFASGLFDVEADFEAGGVRFVLDPGVTSRTVRLGVTGVNSINPGFTSPTGDDLSLFLDPSLRLQTFSEAISVNVVAVPEPAAMGFVIAMGVMMTHRRRRTGHR